MKDCYGTEIEIGSKVAYNYSGQVRIGEVTDLWQKEVQRKERWFRPYMKYRITVKEGDGKSKISSPLNLVVIK